jgi:hypothetical protein
MDVHLPFLCVRVVLRTDELRDGPIPHRGRPTKFVYVQLVSGRAAQAASHRLLTAKAQCSFPEHPKRDLGGRTWRWYTTGFSQITRALPCNHNYSSLSCAHSSSIDFILSRCWQRRSISVYNNNFRKAGKRKAWGRTALWRHWIECNQYAVHFLVIIIQQNTLVRLYIYIYTYTHLVILHSIVTDMFRLWLSHHQGDKIQGIVHDIWVCIFTEEWNFCFPMCAWYCGSRQKLATSTLILCIYKNINNWMF